MMLYICTKFHKNISKGFRVIERTQFPKGDNSQEMPMELQFLLSANRLLMLYICIEYYENIFYIFLSYRADHTNKLKIGAIFP